MSIPFGHHQLHNRYRFSGKIELVTPVKISSGVASDQTDAPFMRNSSGAPYIPGTSIRGAVRSEVERVIAGLDNTVTGLTGCISFEEDCCAEKIKKYQQDLGRNTETGEEHETMDQLLTTRMEETLCDVCKLFGTAGYGSRIFFEDCLPHEPLPVSEIRDGVGIDRDTGAARDSAKFDYEVISEHPFKFKMTVENFDRKGADQKLVNLILGLLANGIYVGGKRSGGLGRIKLRQDYTVTAFENPETLWTKIMNGQNPYSTIKWNGENSHAEA